MLFLYRVHYDSLKYAKELGISPATVTKWKNGSVPNKEIAAKMAAKLDVSVSYLLGDEDISIEKVQELGPRRVVETRDGISFEFGSSSYEISRRIKAKLKG